MQSSTQKPESARQISFLLRLWQASEHGTPNWQASLEMTGTGERIGFANLERLFAYLMEMTEGCLNGTARGDPANPPASAPANP